MKKVFILSLVLFGLFFVQNSSYGIPESADWGYTGKGKTSVEDPIMVAKASQLDTKSNTGLWVKLMIGGLIVSGIFIWIKKNR